MQSLIDQEYISFLSIYLERYTQVSSGVWRFRCPFCGDSQKSKVKARCYIYEKEGYKFHCHNCGVGGYLQKLLKEVAPHLAREYSLKSYFKGEKDPKFKYTEKTEPLPVISNDNELDNLLPTIESLPNKHPAKIYLKIRKIPSKYFNELYWSDDARETRRLLAGTIEESKFPDPRIIIPIKNKESLLVAIQGHSVKSFNENNLRALKYITTKIRNEPKIYGLDKVDISRPVYILEGAFDSMFIDNAVASLDSSLSNLYFPNSVLIYDNEPRNKQIVYKMEQSINKDAKVCIWPNSFNAFKDINDMITSGMTAEYIQSVIRDNTFNGIRARMELDRWKKWN